MPRLVWTPPALRDVSRLYDFLADKNSDAARRAVKTIRQSVKKLTRHPGLGKPVEELLPGYRELVIDFGKSGYVVLYQYDGNRIFILAVRHGREAGTDI